MSKNWVQDIADMHAKYGVHPVVKEFDKDKLEAFLKFRIDFLQEELDEMRKALVERQAGKINTTTAGDDTVDALIDLCVVAIGTLDAFNVDAHKAWDRVLEANMNKEVGIKESRPNPLGLPDLIKPADWVAPTHSDNIGLLKKL
jgi:predicted HAD superfamily Cof-like phosphohydrolase